MDDLSGLSWTSGSNNTGNPPPAPLSSGSLFLSVRPSVSKQTTPTSGNSSLSNTPLKSATPANDSFASLVSFGPSNSSKNLSLLEQQKRLQEERAMRNAERQTQLDMQYGGRDTQFWNALEEIGSKSFMPSSSTASKGPTPPDEDDILAAFNSSAPVDSSTHFPVPSSHVSPQINLKNTNANGPTSQDITPISLDDDDPFGLGQMDPQLVSRSQPVQDTEEDFLGLLAKPVSEFSQPNVSTTKAAASEREGRDRSPKPFDPQDRVIAELVDMGFPVEKARQALDSTGPDVQAAVGWLLNQAHAESQRKRQLKADRAEPIDPKHLRERQRGRGDHTERKRMEEDGKVNRSSLSRDQDVAEVATNIGNRLFKTANSLWKTGSKKVQQAVHDFNVEVDPSQPRWMRDTTSARDNQHSRFQLEEHQHSNPKVNHEDHTNQKLNTSSQLTDEALLLESQSANARQLQRPTQFNRGAQQISETRKGLALAPGANLSAEKHQPKLRYVRQQHQFQASDPKSCLIRAATEEQQSKDYVSPARRRPPAKQKFSEPRSDLIESSAPSRGVSRSISTSLSQSLGPPKPFTPLSTKPEAFARVVPHASPSSLMSSHRQREKGTEAYKRGDYAAAHEAFTRGLSILPEKHPVTIILLSNRAMMSLKIGEPKSAIADANLVLAVIGPSKGEAEAIEIGSGEPAKPMRDFFGKALMRKAEALEQLEKWEEAATVWRQALEAGHGGSTSIQGRNRCEKAAGISEPSSEFPSTARSRVRSKKAPIISKGTVIEPHLSHITQFSASSTEAVSRLRAANEAADRADEEKLALADSVDAKIAAWKGGKQDNLRALLASLDSVLWPEAGWKKVNMSELVLPNKVKVQYMKGIAKVHPDKIPTNATTEQRMIAGAVFGSLNEAWDKFREETNI